ncbi:DUF5610 domain-containing protein [Candidatus Poribacteria bacterium]|nr:DUF5610 domain-containing protein [Candidatus Poribacteria bacterium]
MINGISQISPNSISSFLGRQSTLSYDRLDIRTSEQMGILSERRDASGSRRTALGFSRQQALSYERLVIQEDTSQFQQLQSGNGQDRFDLQASQQYSSYLLIEKITFRVEEQFGFSANQSDRLSGSDTSVEGTASSIYELSITVYSRYEGAALETDGAVARDSVLDGFMSKIHQAVDKGFKDATETLEGMRGFSDEIRSSLEQTRRLIRDLLSRFEFSEKEREDPLSIREGILPIKDPTEMILENLTDTSFSLTGQK